MPVVQRVVATILCLLPTVLWALGVGGIEVSSGLNQAFDARIPIVGAAQGELDDTRAGLAEKDIFDRAGLARPHSLSALKFQVVSTGEDRKSVV